MDATQGYIYKIKFLTQQIQACPPVLLYLSPKDTQLINLQICKLLEKRAIAPMNPPDMQWFLSRMFLIPQKSPEMAMFSLTTSGVPIPF